MQTNLDLKEITNTAIVGPWVIHGHTIGNPVNAENDFNQIDWRDQFIFPTITHWLEASKIVPKRKDLMEAVIFSPSIKEAQKITRLNKEHCRSDWNLVAHSIFSCAVGTLALQRPQFNLAEIDIPTLAEALAGTGYSPSFISTSLIRFAEWRSGPKVCFFGADLAPEDVIGKRVAKTVAPVGTWTLVSGCNKRTSWKLHDWALAHRVPVQYVGTATERMSRTLYKQIISESSTVVVFEKRGDRRHDVPIRLAKEMGKKLVLDLFDEQQDASSLL